MVIVFQESIYTIMIQDVEHFIIQQNKLKVIKKYFNIFLKNIFLILLKDRI